VPHCSRVIVLKVIHHSESASQPTGMTTLMHALQ
jgi:hypothetical protein